MRRLFSWQPTSAIAIAVAAALAASGAVAQQPAAPAPVGPLAGFADARGFARMAPQRATSGERQPLTPEKALSPQEREQAEFARQKARQERLAQREADDRLMAQINAARAGLAPDAPLSSLTERQKGLLALDRLGIGASEGELRAIEAEGFKKWAHAQLVFAPALLPPAELNKILSMPELAGDPTQRAWSWMERQKAAKDAPEEARRALREELPRWRKALFERQAIFSVYSQRPLQEAALAFWQDHFSLFADKGGVAPWLPAWDDNLRARSLAPFPELLASTVTQPAMLEYLDNARSTGDNSWIALRQRDAAAKAGKPAPETGLNENYARELMELHTLGVDGGYTQRDVRELARILTGAGFARSPEPQKMPPQLAGLEAREGAFFFDPRRHDFGDKLFLGKKISGSGIGEIQEALDALSKSPKTARHIAREFAVRYVGDHPSEALVQRLAAAFTRSGGRFGGLAEQAFNEPEFWRGAIARSHAKTPQERLWSALRLAYPQGGITNWEPAWAMLKAQGDLPWDHLTPEGNPRDGASWSSPEQTAQAMQLAQKMADARALWFAPDRLLADAATMAAMAAEQPTPPPATPAPAASGVLSGWGAPSAAAPQPRAPIDPAEKERRQARERSWRREPDAAAAFALLAPVLSPQTLSAIQANAKNPREALGLLLSSPEALGR